MSDPTLELLSRLEDESQWSVKRNVPIFKAHRRKKRDPQTGKITEIEVTEAELEEICETYQRIFDESGVPPRILIGHTLDNAPEAAQPATIGWALNLHVGKWGPKGLPGILCDEYIEPRHAAERAKYPFRSPEYYAGRQQIASVALLKRDPELDLGVVYEREETVAYERAGRPFLYSREINMPDMEHEDPTKPVPGAQTPEDAEYEKAKGHIEKYLSGHPAWKYACDQAAAAAAPPPGVVPAAGAMPPAAPKEPEKMSRTEQALKYERDQLNKRVADLERENRLERYRRQLDDLVGRGVMLDVDEELAECADMDSAAFAKRIDKIATHYTRDPAGVPHVPVLTGGVGKTPLDENEITEKHQEAALKYMREESCDWDEAVEATRPGRKLATVTK